MKINKTAINTLPIPCPIYISPSTHPTGLLGFTGKGTSKYPGYISLITNALIKKVGINIGFGKVVLIE
ncbi:hypothetical protein ACFL96_17655 [Thermoproteota archaeon]